MLTTGVGRVQITGTSLSLKLQKEGSLIFLLTPVISCELNKADKRSFWILSTNQYLWNTKEQRSRQDLPGEADLRTLVKENGLFITRLLQT